VILKFSAMLYVNVIFQNVLRYELNLTDCAYKFENVTDFRLKLKLHSSIDWISLVLSNQTNRDKVILIADNHEIAAYNDKHPDQLLKILDQRILQFNDFICTRMQYKHLVPIYNKAAERLRQNGLLERLNARWIHLENVRPLPIASEPKVLNFDHVGVAFKLSGGFLVLAFIFFVYEVSNVKLRTFLLRKMLERCF